MGLEGLGMVPKTSLGGGAAYFLGGVETNFSNSRGGVQSSAFLGGGTNQINREYMNIL